MRFQVPQFIEVEDKIFGPLTFKQFIYMGGGAGMSVLLYLFAPKLVAFLLIAPILAFAIALAFYKINNKPFIHIVEAWFKYLISSKLYIWKKREKPQSAPSAAAQGSQVYVPRLGDSKLKDLTWSLDIKENLNPVTREEKEI